MEDPIKPAGASDKGSDPKGQTPGSVPPEGEKGAAQLVDASELFTEPSKVEAETQRAKQRDSSMIGIAESFRKKVDKGDLDYEAVPPYVKTYWEKQVEDAIAKSDTDYSHSPDTSRLVAEEVSYQATRSNEVSHYQPSW